MQIRLETIQIYSSHVENSARYLHFDYFNGTIFNKFIIERFFYAFAKYSSKFIERASGNGKRAMKWKIIDDD